MQERKIWTIGHSTYSMDEFVTMLNSFQIEVLIDVRSLPGSRKFPQFNKEVLEVTMPENKIQYHHFKDLGGRRKTSRESKNTGWRLASFRGYADYMETEAFQRTVKQLEDIGTTKRTAYMCAEAVWWRCHRSLISDYLKLHHWTVCHIMGPGKSQEHPYTSPARIVDDQLLYPKDLV